MKTNSSQLSHLNGKRLCLASASPRRLALLQQVGLDPIVRITDLDESQRLDESIDIYVERMAISKAQAAASVAADLIIGADTVVVLNRQRLGKPASPQHARQMLQQLSGQQHQVLTAVAIYQPGTTHCRSQVVTSQVWLKPLTDQEITAYIETREPLDKAGSYGIQGVGAFMVTRMDGSYSGIVGLPLYETLAMLREFS